MVWTGVWDLFDFFLWSRSFWRDFTYGAIALVVLFILEECTSFESLVWLLSTYQEMMDGPEEATPTTTPTPTNKDKDDEEKSSSSSGPESSEDVKVDIVPLDEEGSQEESFSSNESAL